jgi:hypothetical protein
MITIYPTMPEDVRPIALNLRQADCDEIQAGSGKSPLQCLSDSVDCSIEVYTIFETKTMLPCGIFGIAPSDHAPFAAQIWCMGTDKLSFVGVGFLKESVAYVNKFQKQYPVLTNVVDCRNAVHIRYLEWLKFKFIRILPTYGIERRPFVEFCRIDQSPIVKSI